MLEEAESVNQLDIKKLTDKIIELIKSQLTRHD